MTLPPLLPGERIDQLFSTDVAIIQHKDVFSYSVDSVLLSRFPKFPARRGLIIDLCSGNGAVGLFASTQTKAKILQIDIQERLVDMNRRSISLNQLEDQVSVVCDDLANLPKHLGRTKADLILCNPPYFQVDKDSNLHHKKAYLLARHEIATNLTAICQCAQKVLKTNGRLAMVHRPDRLLDILEAFDHFGLAAKRLQFVYPKKGKEANLILIEAIKDGAKSGLRILPPLFVHQSNGNYTDELAALYHHPQKKDQAYMYVLECADGSLYTGYTTNINKRLKAHNNGQGAKYTKTRLPVKLLYQEGFATKNLAMSAESLFKKKSRTQKLDYIKKHQ